MVTSNVVSPSEASKQKEQEIEVIVKILLNGGHQHSLILKSDSPLLRSLLGTVLNRVKNIDSRTLFQIPLEAGRSALCFTSDDLVGVITEPPVYVSPQDEQSEKLPIN